MKKLPLTADGRRQLPDDVFGITTVTIPTNSTNTTNQTNPTLFTGKK
jgi:hypothetical protein